MRIGAMMRTVLHALAQAVVLHKYLPSDRPTEKSHESLKSKLQVCSHCYKIHEPEIKPELSF
jgi:hypothetical protein